jgi:hypothetical protein
MRSLRLVPTTLLFVATSCDLNQSAATLVAPSQASKTSAPDTSTQRLISFLSLAPGERVVAYVEFSGCFNTTKHSLVFEPDSAGMTLTLSKPENGEESGLTWVVPPRLDRLSLWKLDRILAYYRGDKPEHWCTSRVTVDLELYRKGKLITTEHYFDESCHYFGEPKLSGFEALIQLVDFPGHG